MFGVFLTRNSIESAHFSFFSDIKNILRHRLGSLTNTICYTNKNYWANNVSNQSTSQHFLYFLLPDFNVFRAKWAWKFKAIIIYTLIIIFVLLLLYVSLLFQKSPNQLLIIYLIYKTLDLFFTSWCHLAA